MLAYLVRRLLLLVPTLLGIVLITFLIMQLAPGDPVALQYGGALSAQNTAARQAMLEMRRLYGLDDPVLEQFGRWLTRVASLDFGNSFIDSRPVAAKIAERLPVTLFLNAASFFLMFLIAIPIGTWAALHRNRPFDRVSGTGLFILYSLPVPWVALMLLIYAGVEWDLFPITGLFSDHYAELGLFGKLGDILSHSVMPVFCLTYGSLAFTSRLTRVSVLETLGQDHIRAALARGLPHRTVLFRHALKNALLPIITLVGSLLPAMISGSVIVERIFSIPGMGQLFFESIMYRDYPTIMGLSVFSALLTVLGILLADLLYAVVDPRISYARR